MKALADLSRTTAAHSTLIIADRNSSRLLDSGRLGAGVSETLTIREPLDEGAKENTESSIRVKHTHNGYHRRFGVKHERALTLAADGTALKGSDKLFGDKLKKLAGKEILLRFHLHPGVTPMKAPDGRITLETRSGRTWIFDVDGGTAEIEESLYLSRPDRGEPTRQIVVRLDRADDTAPVCNWVLSEMSL
jgi:uncharacterized heparinase superfamily protein